MVERRLLTSAFVKGISPPAKGERWIADTKIKGFGLRLWATKSGGQKAFAIRVRGQKRKTIRKTFDYAHGWETRLHFAYVLKNAAKPDRGDYLDEARRWAQDAIDECKAPHAIQKDMPFRDKRIAQHVRRMTLETAARSMIDGMRLNGLSQGYTDRLDKLFAHNIPSKLKKARLSKFPIAGITDALAKSKASAGGIRILRSFLGQILERAATFDSYLGRYSTELSDAFLTKWKKHREVRFPELNNLSDDRFEAMFKFLNNETQLWQQSHAIRLFFEFHAPLTRVLAGRWDQIIDKHWYPFFPGERKLWFECRENISDLAKLTLDRIAFFSQRDFGASRYWFPSRFGKSSDHIRTVDVVWRNALNFCSLPYYPIREFARSYRSPNTPSYYLSFLRQYGPLIHPPENVARLSKVLRDQKNSLIISKRWSGVC